MMLKLCYSEIKVKNMYSADIITVVSLVAQMVKNLPAMQRPRFNPWMGKIPSRRGELLTQVFLPGEFHRQRNLEGYSLCSCNELDTTEQLTYTKSL